MNKQHRALADAIAKKLADDGNLVEAGYQQLRSIAMPKEAPQVQVDECRLYFMAGAQHLFFSIMSIMDADRDPTPGDMKRMALISAELERWTKTLELRYATPTQGSA